jgi:PAS domain S-box-containing protein
MKKHFISSLFLIWICLFSISCQYPFLGKKAPKAVKGVLDLSDWDFEKDGPVKLNGEWEFYWEKLLKPKDFDQESIPEMTGFFNIPRAWNGYKVEEKELSDDGYATFRINIKHKNNRNFYGLKINYMRTAYKVWMDDKELTSNGKVGISKETMVPQFLPQVITIKPEKSVFQIVLQVSNFYHSKGGPDSIIEFGTEPQIYRKQLWQQYSDVLLFGILLIMALYHFGLFFLRRKDTSTLYFGIFCSLVIAQPLFEGTIIISMFPNFNWELLLKINYLYYYIAVPICCMFINYLYAREFSTKLLRFSQFSGILFSLIVICTPVKIFSHTLMIYDAITFIVINFIMYTLIRAFLNKREGSLLFILGFCFLFITIVNDLLYQNSFIYTGYYVSFGLLFFMLTQSLLLSQRFSKAFSNVENLTKKLQKSEKQYRQLVETMNEGLVSIDEKGSITYANKKLCEMWGISHKEINWTTFEFSDEKHHKIYRDLAAKLKEGKRKSYEAVWIKKDKSKLFVIISCQPVFDSNGNFSGSSAVITDLTELKRAEQEKFELQEKLNRSKKMQALGLLAGGVAHDLNNILSGIVGYPELILEEIPEDSPIRKSVSIIHRSGHRAAAVVQDLLTVARGVASSREVLNLNMIVNDYLSSPEYIKLSKYYPDVVVKTSLDTDLLNINGSLIHFRKVLMNLVSNAVEAISDDGIVTISTKNQYLDTPLRGYEDLHKGEYVVLSVKDEGPGISSDDMERIFEPFYTKKIMGRSGTGLGLTVVWNTMKDHDGYIDLKSDINGTIFDLYFPITREQLPNIVCKDIHDNYSGNGEKILVIDDEGDQRMLVCAMLTKMGYQAEAAANCEEAIHYLMQKSVDLILLDMIMEPHPNGLETYREILKISPQQKAIIASGFAETDDVIKTRELGAGKYIRKPYSMSKIGAAIKEELYDIK